MTEPIIVVKMPGCKLLYIFQVAKRIFLALYLISKILVAYNYSYNAASDWPWTFATARLFLFSIMYSEKFNREIYCRFANVLPIKFVICIRTMQLYIGVRHQNFQFLCYTTIICNSLYCGLGIQSLL